MTKPSHGDVAAFWAVCLALRISGARTVRLAKGPDATPFQLDGLLLGGGSDVHPEPFHQKPKPGYRYDLRRQALELAWIGEARERDLPVLGICRGAQLMNVASGGSLLMDLAKLHAPGRYPDHWFRQAYFRKRIDIEAGSLLRNVLEMPALWVNSVHRQAVGSLGEGLVISAREDNGVIQAIEDPQKRFWLGVQFHPEFLFYRAPVRRLFTAFVGSARDFAHQGGRP